MSSLATRHLQQPAHNAKVITFFFFVVNNGITPMTWQILHYFWVHLDAGIPTESTDATIDTTTMMIEVLSWKIGIPHCKG